MDTSNQQRLRAGAGNSLSSVAMALMTLLPLLEILARKLIGRGLPGSAPIVQHLTLVVAFLGVALAARSDRLLSLSTAGFLPAWLRPPVRLFTSAMTVAVTGGLVWAGIELVRAERQAGSLLALGIRVWLVVSIMPAGFAAVAWRVTAHASPGWRGRLLTALGLAVPVALGLARPAQPEGLVLASQVGTVAAAGGPGRNLRRLCDPGGSGRTHGSLLVRG